MPKRTNEFQQLVYSIQHQLVSGAVVTESKFSGDVRTKAPDKSPFVLKYQTRMRDKLDTQEEIRRCPDSSGHALKLYTLSGSESDAWLADVLQNGFGTPAKLLHGLFNYDIPSILKNASRPKRSINQANRLGRNRLSFVVCSVWRGGNSSMGITTPQH